MEPAGISAVSRLTAFREDRLGPAQQWQGPTHVHIDEGPDRGQLLAHVPDEKQRRPVAPVGRLDSGGLKSQCITKEQRAREMEALGYEQRRIESEDGPGAVTRVVGA